MPTYSAVAQPTIVIAVELVDERVAEQCSRLDATYLTVQPLHAKKLPRAEAAVGARLAGQTMFAGPSGSAFPLKTGALFSLGSRWFPAEPHLKQRYILPSR